MMAAKKTPGTSKFGPKSKAKREALIAEAHAANIAPLDYMSVSYTHLTLPTIYSV